jgi:hypothetical protein
MPRTLLLVVLLGCTQPEERDFVVPRNVEDLRGRLIQQIPAGRDIAGARQWMAQHGFACDPPLASAADAHAQLCHLRGDAGQSRWTVALIEREGRLADVQAR